MKLLAPVKRALDHNVKARVKADRSGMDFANVKLSEPVDEMVAEKATRGRK
jgi:electron transfer flavoprotein beta subunit